MEPVWQNMNRMNGFSNVKGREQSKFEVEERNVRGGVVLGHYSEFKNKRI